MLGTNLIFVTLLIAGVGDVLSTDTAPEVERSNNRNESKLALVIVSDEEILPGSHVEARKREFSMYTGLLTPIPRNYFNGLPKFPSQTHTIRLY